MYFYVLLNCLLWPFMQFLGRFDGLEVIFMLMNVQKNKFDISQKWAWPTNDPLIMQQLQKQAIFGGSWDTALALLHQKLSMVVPKVP